MKGPVLVTLLAVVLAGCASPADVAPSATLPSPLVLPVVEALEYVCPPGGEPSGALCVTTLTDTFTSLQEPFLAVDPARPGVMAVGVNAGHTVGALDAARPRPGVDLLRFDIYVTEDGGAAWRRVQLPVAPAATTLPLEHGGSGDPAIAFDSKGVMHVSGIVNWNIMARGYEIFYTSSPDLGKTWTAPVTFTTDGDNDRNWITVGPDDVVYLPWQNVGDSSEVVWSSDGGATWQGPAKADACITVSPVLVVNATPLLSCATVKDGQLAGVEVHALDVATGKLEARSAIEGPVAVWPQLRALPDGRVLLVHEDYSGDHGTMLAYLSTDTGATWAEPIDVREVLGAAGHLLALWFEVSPEGDLHFVLSESSSDPIQGRFAPPRVSHAAFDPDTLAVIADTTLPSADEVPPRTVAPDYGDHYYGLAFDAAGGHLVWTHDGGLDIGAFVPKLGST